MALRSKKRREEAEPEGAPAWMLTFTDLTQQVLVFFVLLFAMSNVDPVRMMRLAEEFREIAGGAPIPPPDKTSFVPWVVMEFKDVDRPGGAVVKSVEGAEIVVERVREGVKITVEGDALFGEASAEMPPRGRAVLREISDLLRGTYNKVEVRGYTAANVEDSVGGDHWLLGYQRAVSASRQLVEGGVAEARLRLTSGARNDPVAPNLLAEKRGRNRRVEVIVSEEIWDPNQ